MMDWFWLAGVLFTLGFTDPNEKKGFWYAIGLFFTWPIKLGKIFAQRLGL